MPAITTGRCNSSVTNKLWGQSGAKLELDTPLQKIIKTMIWISLGHWKPLGHRTGPKNPINIKSTRNIFAEICDILTEIMIKYFISFRNGIGWVSPVAAVLCYRLLLPIRWKHRLGIWNTKEKAPSGFPGPQNIFLMFFYCLKCNTMSRKRLWTGN